MTSEGTLYLGFDFENFERFIWNKKFIFLIYINNFWNDFISDHTVVMLLIGAVGSLALGAPVQQLELVMIAETEEGLYKKWFIHLKLNKNKFFIIKEFGIGTFVSFD